MIKNKIKPIKMWAVVKNGKLDPMEVYEDKDVFVGRDEELIRVIVTPDEKNTKQNKGRNIK